MGTGVEVSYSTARARIKAQSKSAERPDDPGCAGLVNSPTRSGRHAFGCSACGDGLHLDRERGISEQGEHQVLGDGLWQRSCPHALASVGVILL
jgi:hypothetical protein